ncbi:MAG: dioxygenase [Chlorobi bacterium]|nr:dioxygenase [Chlorobiota bacterium]MCI0716264.1 dioxygenase [Chlorobiota bacterium]
MRQNYPFHYSFLVKDLESTRRFYCEILNCREGRSTNTWVDFDFFGNQLSCHVSDVIPPSVDCGIVDKIVVPIPHFGCIISWDEFNDLSKRLIDAGIPFLITPLVRFSGEPSEQATMFFKDYSGNALEFKSFRNPEHIFTSSPQGFGE